MSSGGTKVNRGLWVLAWPSCGIVMALLFATAQLPPLRVTILMLAAMTVVAIASMHVTELSLLSRLYVLLFSIPFSATLGYMFDGNFVWWQTPATLPLCLNHRLITEMLMMVIVGLCGMMSGIELVSIFGWKARSMAVAPQPMPRQKPTLPLMVTVVLLGISVLFSWLHAPKDSILVSAYASAESGAGMDKETGLNSSYLISYLILILLCVDAEQEAFGSRTQKLKLMLTMAATAYIVVFLQLLRGDRECAGLVGAICLLYISSPLSANARVKLKQGWFQMKRLLKLCVPMAACVAVFLALGSLRHSASQTTTEGGGLWHVIVDGATKNTWTAVALNNLGLASDYHYGNLEYLYGRTYLDYVLSLPPGAITKTIGYERPLDGEANPADWYTGLACGGMHPVVVPFKNMGIFGVLAGLFVCGAFICWCECQNELGQMSMRSMYGCMATSSMLWFWYGDMSMIRTLMIWGLLYLMHKFVATTPRRHSFNPAPASLPRQLPPPRPKTALRPVPLNR